MAFLRVTGLVILLAFLDQISCSDSNLNKEIDTIILNIRHDDAAKDTAELPKSSYEFNQRIGPIPVKFSSSFEKTTISGLVKTLRRDGDATLSSKKNFFSDHSYNSYIDTKFAYGKLEFEASIVTRVFGSSFTAEYEGHIAYAQIGLRMRCSKNGDMPQIESLSLNEFQGFQASLHRNHGFVSRWMPSAVVQRILYLYNGNMRTAFENLIRTYVREHIQLWTELRPFLCKQI